MTDETLKTEYWRCLFCGGQDNHFHRDYDDPHYSCSTCGRRELTDQELKLHLGEMSAGELRVARAAVLWANTTRPPSPQIEPVERKATVQIDNEQVEKLNKLYRLLSSSIDDQCPIQEDFLREIERALCEASESLTEHQGGGK